jgi:hypothetical protein
LSTLSDLPKISDAFLTHIEGRILRRGKWLPCPRCGSSEVDPAGGSRILLGGVAGLGCVGACGCIAIAVAAVGWFFLLESVGWPLAAIILIIGLAFGTLLTLSGRSYSCKVMRLWRLWVGLPRRGRAAEDAALMRGYWPILNRRDSIATALLTTSAGLALLSNLSLRLV